MIDIPCRFHWWSDIGLPMFTIRCYGCEILHFGVTDDLALLLIYLIFLGWIHLIHVHTSWDVDWDWLHPVLWLSFIYFWAVPNLSSYCICSWYGSVLLNDGEGSKCFSFRKSLLWYLKIKKPTYRPNNWLGFGALGSFGIWAMSPRAFGSRKPTFYFIQIWQIKAYDLLSIHIKFYGNQTKKWSWNSPIHSAYYQKKL